MSLFLSRVPVLFTLSDPEQNRQACCALTESWSCWYSRVCQSRRRRFQSICRRLEVWAISFTTLPVSFGRDSNNSWSRLSGVYARRIKLSHTRGKCVTCRGLTEWASLTHCFCCFPVCSREALSRPWVRQ